MPIPRWQDLSLNLRIAAMSDAEHAPRACKWRRVGGLIGLSVVLSLLLAWLQLPAAFLLGPMVAAALIALMWGALSVPAVPFQLAQAVVGCMIARTITLPILQEIGRDWPVFVAGVMAVILASLVIGWFLTRWQVVPGPTAIWGTSAGAAVAMTLMSASYGADERLVALMQYLRVVVVAVSASILAAFLAPNANTSGVLAGWLAPVSAAGMATTLAVAGVGFCLGRLLNIGAGALIVAMILGALLQDVVGATLALPEPLLAISYAVIGWAIGMRFTRETLRYALRALPAVLASIVLLVLVCGGIGGVLVVFAGVDPLTAYLATSPGGADTVAIIASGTHVDVAYVMAMQMARFLAVMFLGPPLARLMTHLAGYRPGENSAT